MTEDELIEAIAEAKAAEDWVLVKSLMEDLIALQKLEPVIEISDAELAERGFEMELITEERRLRDAIKQAEQDGDFLEAKELHQRLIQIQKLQPRVGGVKLR